MPVDLSYPNARIRAMRSHLLNRDFFTRLLSIEESAALISALAETSYQEDIEAGTLKYPGTLGVEEAFRTNIMRSFSKIMDMVDGTARELVEVLLGRWDVQSIKTVLRGKNIGATQEEILGSLIPAGQLDEVFLTELARQPDVKACVDLLLMGKVSYAKALADSFPKYQEDKNLVYLELALDRFFYEWALDQTSRNSFDAQLVREVIMREIDVINIMSALRLVTKEASEDRKGMFFIEGGKHIDKSKFESLLQSDEAADVAAGVENTPYGPPLAEVQAAYMKTGVLSVIERSLERFLVTQNIKLFRADPLSIALIVAYVWAKYNEVVNLRVIVRGKSLGMPPDRIEADLVF
ncbi:MAG: ATP synthase A1 subunit C [Terriglobia bacterium]